MTIRALLERFGLFPYRPLKMKLLIDFFPIILFFAAFKLGGIYVATTVAIAATVVQIAYLRLRHGKVEVMQWLSLGVIVVFGGATLVAHNETFIKCKPTALYWLMGGALVVGQWFFRKNFVRTLMQAQIELPDPIWLRLNSAWSAFFLSMGVLNLWVAYQFDTETWVNFKLFGSTGLLLVFVIAQGVWLSKHMEHPSE